jgi:predicted transcriptional regulator
MGKSKVTRAERRRTETKALKLLRSANFFNEFLRALKEVGLVGEEQNALVLLIVVVSRILPRPLNAFVKGRSSGGKNWLLTRVLSLTLRSAVAEITSASDRAWNYSGSDFRHKVVYIQEQNEAAGTIDPIRLLISEGKLIRIVTRFEGGKRVAKKYVARGPVAAISTSTKNRLKIDDENRHVSIWIDESPEQTRRIAEAYTQTGEPFSRKERRVWHGVHSLLEKKIGTKVVFPAWFAEIAKRLLVDDLRVRRYYPAFAEACRTVALIRSFQPDRKPSKHGELVVDFADFAITALIFDSVFVESLHLNKTAGEATRRLVEEIIARKGRPVDVKDLVKALKISKDKAYSKLRYAEQAGVIRRANKPEKGNRKLYRPAPRPRFVPDPKKLFRKLKDLGEKVRFVHPLTGEWITYHREQ